LHWKRHAVLAHVERGGEAFVWIDDDLTYMAPHFASTVADNRHLLVTPDWLVGLTPRQLDIVDRFLLELDGESKSPDQTL
jgi:hypothetical protein